MNAQPGVPAKVPAPQVGAGSAGRIAPTTVIGPTRGWAALRLRQLWRYRELLYLLAWRDVKVRYKQTLIGAAWAVLQPLLTMIVFTVVFGHLVPLPSGGVPYPVFAYAGLVLWMFFASALSQAGNSVVGNTHLISKVYFPRLIVPIAAVLTSAIDFAVAFVLLLGMLLFYRIVPGVAVLTIPFFLVLALLTALGCGLWLAALNVRYRDIGSAIPFLIQFWLFLTPVVYPSSLIPARWQVLYGLNPMAGVIEGFRWALFGTGQPPGGLIGVSSVVVLLVFIGGLFYFRRMERDFADVI